MYVDQTGQLGGGELSLLDFIDHSTHYAEVALFADGPFRVAIENLGVTTHLIRDGSIGKVRRTAGICSALAALPALIRMTRHLRQLTTSFDILYANSQKAFLVCTLARHRGQPLIWHLRDMLTAQHFSPVLRSLAVFLGNRFASVVITNSHATADAFVEAGGRRDKIRVVHNGISSENFDAVNEGMVSEIRLDLGLEGKFLVGSFGRLSPWKGQHILLEAASRLPGVHVVLVGQALFGEDRYRARLVERAHCHDLDGRVHFLGFRRDIPLLMKCMSVIAHTSTAPEPFGRVIVEAMLAARPVIVARGGGALEIVNDEQVGLLVTPGSSEELAAAIERISLNPSLQSKLQLLEDRERSNISQSTQWCRESSA